MSKFSLLCLELEAVLGGDGAVRRLYEGRGADHRAGVRVEEGGGVGTPGVHLHTLSLTQLLERFLHLELILII